MGSPGPKARGRGTHELSYEGGLYHGSGRGVSSRKPVWLKRLKIFGGGRLNRRIKLPVSFSDDSG